MDGWMIGDEFIRLGGYIRHLQGKKVHLSIAHSLPLHFFLHVLIHVLIDAHVFQPFLILPQLHQLLHLLRFKMWPQVPLEFLQDFRLRLLSPQLVPQWCLHDRLFEHGAILERDGEGVGYRPHVGIVVGSGEVGVFDARDLPPQLLDERAGGSFRAVGIVCRVQTVEDEHGRYHVLYAVVSVGEVVHGFVLFVNDADASFVGAAGDGLDVFRGLSLFRELGVDLFGSFDGGLGVEFGWVRKRLACFK